jgi:hypothetical protein
MYCERCGVEGPTKKVDLHRNIGLLVMRMYQGTSGNLCKPCIHKTFWNYTLVNVTVGWWGIISVIVTPIFVVNNLVYYFLSLGMEPPAPGAKPPELTDEFFSRIQPHTDQLIQRLSHGEKLAEVSQDIATRAGVTPGQVALFVRAIAQQQQQKQQGR